MTHCLVSIQYGRLIDVKILKNDKHRTAIGWPRPLYRGGSNTRTVEPRFNEPLHNKVLSITNDFPGPSNSKIYGNEPREE